MAQLNAKILLRVSEAERDQIQTDARQRGKSVNNYLRTVALGYPEEEQQGLESRITQLETRVRKLESK